MTEETTNDRPGVRASNADRERVASILRTAGTEGLLTLDEMDERLTSAYAAVYRHDLDPLTADLPGAGRPLYSRSPEGQAQRDQIFAHYRRNLITHGVVAAGIIAAAITTWALVGAGHHFFPGPLIAIAIISLAIHARRARWGYYGRPPWAHTQYSRENYWA